MENKGVELSFQVDLEIQKIWSKYYKEFWTLNREEINDLVNATTKKVNRLSRNIYAMMSLDEIQKEKRILNFLLLEGRIEDFDYQILSQLIIHAEDNLK